MSTSAGGLEDGVIDWLIGVATLHLHEMASNFHRTFKVDISWRACISILHYRLVLCGMQICRYLGIVTVAGVYAY